MQKIKSDKSSLPIFLALLPALSILFRGLFFEKDYFIFAMVATLLGIGLLVAGRTRLHITGLNDIALGALTLCFVLSLFSATSTYAALTTVLKYLLLRSDHTIKNSKCNIQLFGITFHQQLVPG